MDRVPASPEELLELHGPAIYAVAYRVCLRHDLAEEAAAAAVHSAWRRLPGFAGRSSFKTWVKRIALNAAIDAVRRERAQSPISGVPLEEAAQRADLCPEAAPSAGAEAEERGRRVRAALAAMDELHRGVLVLREWEGLSYQEIADALECPIGTVMSRLSHARRILRDRLGTEEP